MSIEEVARLYGINPDEYMKAMCSPKVKVGTEYVTKGQTVQQCEYSIAALTKAAFGRLFDWLVRVINRALGNDMPKDFFIGILGKLHYFLLQLVLHLVLHVVLHLILHSALDFL